MAADEISEEERAAIAGWLTANDINPNTVPLHSELSIANGVIRFEQYILTDDGNKQVNPHDRNRAWTKDASAPCRVRPPAGLHIPEGS